MKKNILYVLILFLSITAFSQTQKADLIFNDGVVLQGYGMITKNNKIKFRISLDEKPDVWTNLMVKSIIFYGFEVSAQYDYVKLNKKQKPLLLKVISTGKVTLYEYEVNGQSSYFDGKTMNRSFYNNSTLYMKRVDEKVATRLGGNFKKVAKEYFKDCKEIQDLLKDGEFKKYTRIEIVEFYNLFCSD